jgi:hypothetical protein
MFKTARSIEKEVEQIKQVLMPSEEKTLIIHMWRPGDEPSDTSTPKLPPDDSPHNVSESEIIAKGLREHRRVIIVPLSEKPNPSELKEYLKTMAREEAEKE